MQERPNEAVIVLCKCPTNHKTFGMRAEKIGNSHWNINWAFPIKDDAAKREGYDKSTIGGIIEYDALYPGCPYCSGSNFVLCGRCAHLCCNTFDNGLFTCEWCGKYTTDVVMHQVRTLKDLDRSLPWIAHMIKINRKTLVVCPQCHEMIHSH